MESDDECDWDERPHTHWLIQANGYATGSICWCDEGEVHSSNCHQ